MNILDLAGKDFLKLYWVVFAAAIALGVFLRQVLRGRRETGADLAGVEIPRMRPLEVAFLAGGKRLAVNTAITNLFRKGSVTVTAKTHSIAPVRPPAQPSDPIEDDVYRVVGSGGATHVRNIHGRVDTSAIAQRQREDGLLLSAGERGQIMLISALPLMLLLLTGFAKISVGVSRNRPVGFLIFSCFATIVAMMIFIASAPRRTRRGDAVLDEMRTENAALLSNAKSAPGALGIGEFALAMGLFGPTVLAGDGLTEVRQALGSPNGSVGASYSSCGSGCGGGGGGGGSCGGGCGGGCGGCGG